MYNMCTTTPSVTAIVTHLFVICAVLSGLPRPSLGEGGARLLTSIGVKNVT